MSEQGMKIRFTAGVDCQNENEWCLYMEPHKHGGFACDETCPCRSESSGSGSES